MKKRVILLAIVVIVLILVSSFFVVNTLLLANQEYKVTFFSDSGNVLAIETAKRNHSPEPPNNPSLEYGSIFSGWDTDIRCVKNDLKVYPKKNSFLNKPNVFALSGAYGKVGNTVSVPFCLRGDVCLSGVSVSIKYDSSVLKLQSVYDVDGAVIYNTETDGIILMNYTSLENTVGDIDFCTFKFKIKKDAEQSDLNINVDSICANKKEEKIYTPKYNLIDSTIYILPNEGSD